MSYDPSPDGFVPDDPDRQIGLLFTRLASLNRELGHDSHRRAVQAALLAIGTTALAEAERRAEQLAERGRPATTTVRVTAFAARKQPEPFDESNV